MLDNLLHWVAANEGFGAYAILSLGAALEYIFPPFPGDTVTLFGVFLSVTAGYRTGIVFAAVNIGSMVGSLCAYAMGHWLLGHPDRSPKFLTSERAAAAIAGMRARFQSNSTLYLIVNRFIPGFRAVALVAAGMSRVALWRVVLFGGLSSLAWNAFIFAIGFAVGNNWTMLQRWVSRYTFVVVGIAILVAAAFWIRSRKNRREPRG